MSLLCGCASKPVGYSPSHTTNKMSRIRPPSTTPSGGSRFGFAQKQQKKSSTATSKPLELSAMDKPQSALTGVLALDPSALLSGNEDDNLGGYVPRNDTGTERTPRPMSSIVTLSHSNALPEQPHNITSYDDTNPSGKPKSGLRSFFARKFSQDKAASNRAVTGNVNNMNNSQSDSSLSRLYRPKSKSSGISDAPMSRNNSTDSNRSNVSNKSKSKLFYKGNSPVTTGSQRIPKNADSKTNGHKISVTSQSASTSSTVTSASQKVGLPVSKSAASTAVITATSSTKYSSNSKLSRLSFPLSKLSTYPANDSKDQCLANQMASDSKQLDNGDVNTELYEHSSNIDLRVCIEAESSAPVATVDADLETSFSTAATDSDTAAVDTDAVCRTRSRTHTAPCTSATASDTNILSSSPSAHSMTGSTSTERKRPTIEILPLTHDNLNAVDCYSKTEQSREMGAAHKKTSNSSLSSLRTYSVDEDLLSSIISEVNSLRQTVVELEHHLIGKQEHEEKMKADLRSKNEIISLLTSKLNHCTCQRKNGFGKAAEDDLLALAVP